MHVTYHWDRITPLLLWFKAKYRSFLVGRLTLLSLNRVYGFTGSHFTALAVLNPFVITHARINALDATPTYQFLLNASLCSNAERTPDKLVVGTAASDGTTNVGPGPPRQ